MPPPAIVAPLAPAAEVTRMPPLLIVFVPESVTEKPPAFGPAALNRKLLVVWPLIGIVLRDGGVVAAAPSVVGVGAAGGG